MTRRDFDEHHVKSLAHQFRSVIQLADRPFTHSNMLRLWRRVYRELRAIK